MIPAHNIYNVIPVCKLWNIDRHNPIKVLFLEALLECLQLFQVHG